MSDRRRVQLETVVVAFLTIVPFFVGSLVASQSHQLPQRTANQYLTILVVQSLQVVVPLLYIMWRSGEAPAYFGLIRFRPLLDGLVSLLALEIHLLLSFCLSGVRSFADVATKFWAGGLVNASPLSALAHGSWWQIVATSACAAGLEELAVRGFLLPRFITLGVSKPLAVAGTSLLFGSYHFYNHGFFGGLSAFAGGLVYGVAFLRWRSVWPCIMAHFAWDTVMFEAVVRRGIH